MQQPSITLVLGGVRSGKTAWAEAEAVKLASGASKPLYLATGRASDGEMKARIERHRRLRGDRFTTIEAPVDIAPVIAGSKAGDVLLVDSMGVWINNLALAGADIETAISGMLDAAGARAGACVFVSEEVGLGIVPDNAAAREFGDRIGALNQRLAALADRVVLVVAGIPTTIKE